VTGQPGAEGHSAAGWQRRRSSMTGWPVAIAEVRVIDRSGNRVLVEITLTRGSKQREAVLAAAGTRQRLVPHRTWGDQAEATSGPVPPGTERPGKSAASTPPSGPRHCGALGGVHDSQYGRCAPIFQSTGRPENAITRGPRTTNGRRVMPRKTTSHRRRDQRGSRRPHDMPPSSPRGAPRSVSMRAVDCLRSRDRRCPGHARVVRLMAHVERTGRGSAIQHVYLGARVPSNPYRHSTVLRSLRWGARGNSGRG